MMLQLDLKNGKFSNMDQFSNRKTSIHKKEGENHSKIIVVNYI